MGATYRHAMGREEKRGGEGRGEGEREREREREGGGGRLEAFRATYRIELQLPCQQSATQHSLKQSFPIHFSLFTKLALMS